MKNYQNKIFCNRIFKKLHLQMFWPNSPESLKNMLCQNNCIVWRKHLKKKKVLVQQQLSLHYHSCKKGLIRNSGRERSCKWLGPCLKRLGTLSLPLPCLWGPIRQSSVSDVLLGALITIKLPLICFFSTWTQVRGYQVWIMRN